MPALNQPINHAQGDDSDLHVIFDEVDARSMQMEWLFPEWLCIRPPTPHARAQGDDSDLHVIIFDEIDAVCKQRGSVASGTVRCVVPRPPARCCGSPRHARRLSHCSSPRRCARLRAATCPCHCTAPSAPVVTLQGVHDSVVNQLLTKIDGVDALNNILLIGMTNRRARVVLPGRH